MFHDNHLTHIATFTGVLIIFTAVDQSDSDTHNPQCFEDVSVTQRHSAAHFLAFLPFFHHFFHSFSIVYYVVITVFYIAWANKPLGT